MTDSKEYMRDIRPSNDQVRIGDYQLIDVECVGTLTIVFPSVNGEVTLRLEDVAYVPRLKYNLLPLIVAHQNKMLFRPEENELTLSLLDGRLKFPFDGSSYAQTGYRIEGSGMLCPSERSLPMMEVQRPLSPKRYDTVAFPVLAPGSSAISPIADINDFHNLYGHSNEFILRQTANKLGIELEGTLKPCAGCSMAKGYRKPIASRTNTRADK